VTGQHGWALVFTDHQRQLAIEALTGKATQIEQATRESSGPTHAAALRTAQEYAALAVAFKQVGPDSPGDTLVSLPRDKWLLMIGWIAAALGEDDYPWFAAEFLAAVHRAAGLDLPGDDR
jgi:hypothetical protein